MSLEQYPNLLGINYQLQIVGACVPSTKPAWLRLTHSMSRSRNTCIPGAMQNMVPRARLMRIMTTSSGYPGPSYPPIIHQEQRMTLATEAWRFCILWTSPMRFIWTMELSCGGHALADITGLSVTNALAPSCPAGLLHQIQPSTV